ncbi:MAG: cytochrome c1 [Betaproteobacteria bacterium]|nr:cytochrome c1 [Betaproteobacteria bacterium]
MKTHIIKLLKSLAAVVLFAPTLAIASTEIHLDKAPVSTDQQKLQHGAELFIKHCLNCHSASSVRYTELRKIGFDDQTITDKLLYSDGKIADMMTVAMTRADAEAWFGIAPPDLSVMARAKASESGSGADYLYTYLRSFYKDEHRPTGWNNKTFPNVGMPHAMWDMQGTQTAVEENDGHGGKTVKLVAPPVPGSMSAEKYDEAVADIVSFMVWMGEPGAEKRKFIGIFVIIFLAAYYVLTRRLGHSYWKNIH